MDYRIEGLVIGSSIMVIAVTTAYIYARSLTKKQAAQDIADMQEAEKRVNARMAKIRPTRWVKSFWSQKTDTGRHSVMEETPQFGVITLRTFKHHASAARFLEEVNKSHAGYPYRDAAMKTRIGFKERWAKERAWLFDEPY